MCAMQSAFEWGNKVVIALLAGCKRGLYLKAHATGGKQYKNIKLHFLKKWVHFPCVSLYLA